MTRRAAGSGRDAEGAGGLRTGLGALLLLVLAAAAVAVFVWLPGRAVTVTTGSAEAGRPPASGRNTVEPPVSNATSTAGGIDQATPERPPEGADQGPRPPARPAASTARALPSSRELPVAPPAPAAQALAAGLEALAKGDARGAEGALRTALELDPESGAAAAALEEARALLLAEALAARVEQARQAEEHEDWRGAETAWKAALALDPTVKVALRGKERAAERAALAEAMAYHLDHPERLAAPAVLAEAESLLVRAETATPAGSAHTHQVAALAELLDRARRPVTVVLTSDEQTEVTIQRVGRLGRFGHRELELRPGVYTVIGIRRGYRDVRRRLEVRAGDGSDGEPVRLDVRCEEAF